MPTVIPPPVGSGLPPSGGGATYTLPAATATIRGGVRVGTTLTIADDVLDINGAVVATQSWVSGLGYAVASSLGGAAVLNVGTIAGTVAAGNDTRLVGALQSVPAPGTATLGGILSAAAAAGQFVTGINASGAPTFGSPAASRAGLAFGILRAWDGGAVMQAGTFWLTYSLPAAVLADTLVVNPGTGTITAIVRNNGTGLAGGTITATGTVATATITGSPTLAAGSSIDLVLSSPSGSPAGAIELHGRYA